MPQLPGSNAPFELPPLPWSQDALEPHIRRKTIELHYGKHHKGYVEKLNRAVEGTRLAELPLEGVVAASARDTGTIEIFHNAAQAWNHAFYWKCMHPGGGGEPSGELADRIARDLGGFRAFREEFEKAANGQFGSGWAWLVLEDGQLEIEKTSDADTPIMRSGKPLLAIDVWEHAYYLDYRNERAKYVTAFVDHLIDWVFVARNLVEAEAERGSRRTAKAPSQSSR